MIDLTQYVRGIDGEPEIANQQATTESFDEPVEVTYRQGGQTKTAEFNAGFVNLKKLTFRTMLAQAVRQAPEGKDVPDIDRRTELLIKLLADKARLDTEEKADIIKCVRAGGDPLHLARTKALFEAVPAATNGHPEAASKK